MLKNVPSVLQLPNIMSKSVSSNSLSSSKPEIKILKPPENPNADLPQQIPNNPQTHVKRKSKQFTEQSELIKKL
jgi:hypothetical protein